MVGIQVKNLSKGYHEKTVLKDVSFEIKEPGVYLIAGPNGCSKTTLLEILAGGLKRRLLLGMTMLPGQVGLSEKRRGEKCR